MVPERIDADKTQSGDEVTICRPRLVLKDISSKPSSRKRSRRILVRRLEGIFAFSATVSVLLFFAVPYRSKKLLPFCRANSSDDYQNGHSRRYFVSIRCSVRRPCSLSSRARGTDSASQSSLWNKTPPSWTASFDSRD